MADYCTIVEVKQQLPESGLSASQSYDASLAFFITAASRAIDREIGRWANYFYPTTDSVTRIYDGSGCDTLWIDEFVSVGSVAVAESGGLATTDYTTWSSSDYVTYPYNSTPIIRLDVDTLNGSKLYFDSYRKSVKVTGVPGYSATPPEDVKQACIIQVIRWFMKSKQAYADTGAGGDVGGVTINVNSRETSKLDNDISALLYPYKVANIGMRP